MPASPPHHSPALGGSAWGSHNQPCVGLGNGDVVLARAAAAPAAPQKPLQVCLAVGVSSGVSVSGGTVPRPLPGTGPFPAWRGRISVDV